MATRNYSNNSTVARLSGSATSASTSLPLVSFAGFPTPPFTAAIERGTEQEEVVLVTAVVGSTVTVTRGYDGTTAKSHTAGADFLHVTVAKDYDEANTHINTTLGVHGRSSALVGVSDTQTLTNKTLSAPVLQSPTVTGVAALNGGATATTFSTTGLASLASARVTAAPAVDTDITNRLYVDGKDTALGVRIDGVKTTADGVKVKTDAATAAATVNTLVLRDVNGLSRFVKATATTAPAAVDELTRKDYVDQAITAALFARVRSVKDQFIGSIGPNRDQTFGVVVPPDKAFAHTNWAIVANAHEGFGDARIHTLETNVTGNNTFQVRVRSEFFGGNVNVNISYVMVAI